MHAHRPSGTAVSTIRMLSLLACSTASASIWGDFDAQHAEGEFVRCRIYGADASYNTFKRSYRTWGMCWLIYSENLQSADKTRRPESTFANERVRQTFKWEGLASFDPNLQLAEETLRLQLIDPQAQRSSDAGHAITQFRCIDDPWLESATTQCSVLAYTRTPELNPLFERGLYGTKPAATIPRTAELPREMRDALREQRARHKAQAQGVRQSTAEARQHRDDRESFTLRTEPRAGVPAFQSKAYDPVAAEFAALAGDAGTVSVECKRGYITRLAGPNDFVCAPPEARQRSARENAQAFQFRASSSPKATACITGYRYREAFVGDVVCVTPTARARVQQENALAASRRAP